MKLKQLPKKMWMVLAILLCSVVSAQAANITYSLTTHVDGRTITATANLNAGDDLNDKMPQTLWRAYTTYKYYSDAALTQEITEAPADGGTVYVDYEFDPPFYLSEEGQEPIYHYLRTYNEGAGNTYLVYYKQTEENTLFNKQTIKAWEYKGTLPKVGTNNPLAKAGHVEWAFYGDAYDFRIKVNDPDIANPWLIWTATSGEKHMALGSYPSPGIGWQLYVNTATGKKVTGTMAMGVPGTTNYLADLENLNSSVDTDGLDVSKQFFDSHNQLVHKTGTSSSGSYQRQLWWYAFFATPVTSNPATTDIWHVTYKIQKADGTWYDDIVVQKRASNLTPTWPVAGFTPVEGYEYDYFYTDATFTEKFEGAMPNDRNSILYIKETVPVPEIYYVTYKIQQADGTWYEDIVKEKDPNNLTPAFPYEEYSMIDGCEYDYFYQDETFQEKFEGDMPANENTVLYIKEKVIEYVSEPWKTLVIPFGIESLASFFGEDFEGVPAVDVLEFQNIEDGVITRVGDEDFYRCKLIFNPVYFIEAYKPYLIRLNRAYKSARDEMYAAEKGERDCEVTIVNDPANACISVYMEGTLEDNGYSMDASDGLHFYFGYDDRANAYNFYRVSAQIPRNRCWFEVVDQRPAGAKLNVTFDMDAITGIGQVVSAKAADGRIYNINGQQVQGTFQKGIYIVNGKKVIVK